jgi:hypothetical protein
MPIRIRTSIRRIRQNNANPTGSGSGFTTLTGGIVAVHQSMFFSLELTYLFLWSISFYLIDVHIRNLLGYHYCCQSTVPVPILLPPVWISPAF